MERRKNSALSRGREKPSTSRLFFGEVSELFMAVKFCVVLREILQYLDPFVFTSIFIL